MKTNTIREKLCDFIRVADDKMVRAIFTLLEDEMTEDIAWWEDEEFVAELDEERKAWEAGKIRGFSMDEVETSLKKLRQKPGKVLK